MNSTSDVKPTSWLFNFRFGDLWGLGCPKQEPHIPIASES